MNVIDRSQLPAVELERPFTFPEIVKERLANGLELRAVPHRAMPIVSASLMVRGGSASDPADGPGLTALITDLLDERTGEQDALAIADAVARIGGELEVEVGHDAVTVSLTMLRRFATQGVQLLAQLTTDPALDRADFARVRKLRLERLRQLKNHPAAVAEQMFARHLYGSHPYAHLGLGTEEALAAATVEDVRAFYRRMFAPGGATLVVAGDFPVDALVEAGTLAFGGWSAGDARDGFNRQAGMMLPPPPPANRVRIGSRSGAAQSELRIGHVCSARDTPDYFALIALNAILGGQFVSRLNLNLREDKGFTYGVRTGFDLRRGRGPFVLQTSVQTEVTAAAVRESLGELEAIRGARPPRPDELKMAKDSLTRGYPRGFETVQGVTRAVGQLALHQLPDSYFADFTASVQAVTLEDVARVARGYLDPARAAIVIVGDSERIRASLEELSIGALDITA